MPFDDTPVPLQVPPVVPVTSFVRSKGPFVVQYRFFGLDQEGIGTSPLGLMDNFKE